MSEDRRRLVGMILLAVGGISVIAGLIVLLTGGDDGGDTVATVGPVEDPEPATETSSTTTTTTTSSTSTTTTTVPIDDALAAARAAVGTYAGQWNNATFGSSGPITLDVVLDEGTRTLIITVDLGGNVFGGSDPEPVLIQLGIDDPSNSLTSELFGDMTVSFEGAQLTVMAENIPAPGIATMTVVGSFDPSGSEFAYVIEFDGGDGAEGTASLGPVTPASAPGDDQAEPDATGDIESVEDFFAAFVDAIESGDVDFLFDRLHPVVVEQSSAELCREFIEREILALVDYRITGDVVGPTTETIAGVSVPDVFVAPTAFDFQGESFEVNATFALGDGRMRWFTECR